MADGQFIDKTGQPRSDNDIQEALEEVNRQIVKVTCEPSLFVLLPTIRQALQELLGLRRKIREAVRKSAPEKL